MITEEQFTILLPLAVEWAKENEAIILQKGVPLTESQVADACTLGISQVNRIRLMKVTTIPVPNEPSLKAAAQATNLITPQTAGLTLRYGIFIRSDCLGDRRLIVHELVHTSQYEKLGGFLPFLQKYLHQCITIGYPAAPMEQEAINRAASLIGYAIDPGELKVSSHISFFSVTSDEPQGTSDGSQNHTNGIRCGAFAAFQFQLFALSF